MNQRKALILVEARGAFFRPEGVGDYQPAAYNSIQAIELSRRLMEEGIDPHLTFIIDNGLSPEEYSLTDKFVSDRGSNRSRIISDFRERHGIVYGTAPFLDPTQTNSSAYRFIADVKDSKDHDLSLEEVDLARQLIGIPYSDFEVSWWRHFILNSNFLRRFGFSQEKTDKLVHQTIFATNPTKVDYRNLPPIERDYINSVLDLLRSYISGVTDTAKVDNFLKAIGVSQRRLKDRRYQLYVKFPVNGHLTSSFDFNMIGAEGGIKIRQKDRLGLVADEKVLSFEELVSVLISTAYRVTSYPLTFAQQLIDERLIRYAPLKDVGPRIDVDPTIEFVYFVAEDADPQNPNWDRMHLGLISQLENIFKPRKVTAISYPTDRLVDPDIEGRRRNPRDTGIIIWEKIKDLEVPGVIVNG